MLKLVWTIPLVLCAGLLGGVSLAINPSRAAEGPASEEAAPQPETPGDALNWPLFRGNSFATGVAVGTLPERLELLWRYEVPQGSFEATPVIVDQVVFLGDLDGTLHAIDLQSGQAKWTTKIESGFSASPAYSAGRVLLGDYDGKMHCVDAQTGKSLWTFDTKAEINSSVSFHADHVLFGSQDATLYCLTLAEGQLVWKQSLQDQIRCSPTIVAERCFVAGCDGALHIINVNTGEPGPSVPINAPTGVTPAVQGDHVYFGTEAGDVFAVDWRQAKSIWTFADAKSGQPIRSCPAVRNDLLVIGSRSKKVYALETATGKLNWTFPTRSRVDSSPVIVGPHVYFGSGDGRLYGLNLADGSKHWEYEAGGGFTGGPAVAAGKLVIANERGTVFCFGGRPESSPASETK